MKAQPRPGDQVKLMWGSRKGGERMWATITHRDGDRLVGTLDSWAVIAYLRPGTTIKFPIDDVIDCVVPDEDDEVA